MELLERLRGQLDADGMERETKKVPSHLLHDHDRKNEHAKGDEEGPRRWWGWLRADGEIRTAPLPLPARGLIPPVAGLPPALARSVAPVDLSECALHIPVCEEYD